MGMYSFTTPDRCSPSKLRAELKNVFPYSITNAKAATKAIEAANQTAVAAVARSASNSPTETEPVASVAQQEPALSEATPDEVRRTLGAIITKPELSDKLLEKPPFVFIHDIFSQVTKATGFGNGLFEGDWLDGHSEIFKLKDADKKFLHRPAYLTSIIDVVAKSNKRGVIVDVANVMTGHEAQATRAFLVALAKAATTNLVSGPNAVHDVLKMTSNHA